MTSLRGRPGGFTTSTDRSGVIERVRRVWEYRRILALLIGRDLIEQLRDRLAVAQGVGGGCVTTQR